MNRRALIFAAAVLLGSLALRGQDKMRYELAESRNFYLDGNNIAGMRCDSLSISNASLKGDYTFGDNRYPFEAPSQWSAGLKASSIMHLRKVSFYGSFKFLHSAFYNACGSMFINPGRYPVDLVEYTPGGKSSQNYAFTGGFSSDIAEHWRIGARVDFSATNYVKTKDLRYTDYALDFSVKPSFQWVSGDWTLGAALALERNTETINAEQVSESNTEYDAFIDKGLGYGIMQEWKGGALHLSESGISGFPVMELGYGASAQLSWRGLYAELSYMCSSGKMGEKDAIWFKFPSQRAALTLGYQFTSDNDILHIFRAKASFKHTCLGEAIMESVTSGGVTTREIYGYNTILATDSWIFNPSWNMVRNGRFDVNFEALYSNQTGLSTLYFPYAATRKLNSVRFDIDSHVNLCKNVLLGLRAWMGGGWLDENLRKAPSDVVSDVVPRRSEDYYRAWVDMNTNDFVGAKLGLRYIFKNNMYLQPEISSEFRYGKHRTSAGLTYGYNF